jgi:hypothetical protein
MTDPNANTITPERQMAAQQVGSVFNSIHEYLRGLEPVAPDDPSRTWLTEQLKMAHARIDEGAMWAIKSVLTFGVKPRPRPQQQPANDEVKSSAESAGANQADTQSAATAVADGAAEPATTDAAQDSVQPAAEPASLPADHATGSEPV